MKIVKALIVLWSMELKYVKMILLNNVGIGIGDRIWVRVWVIITICRVSIRILIFELG